MNFSRMSIVVLLGALVLSPLCAGGDHERGGMSRHMEMKGFTQLEVSSGIRVEITQGNGFSVQARGDRSAIDRIEMRVQGNTLHIGFKPVWFGSGSVTVAVAMPALEAIDLSGGSQGLLDFDASKGRPVSLSLSGGSQLQGTLLASDIAIELSGGSQLTLGGYAMNGRVEASGGSRLNGMQFALDKARFELSGGSYAGMAVQTAITVDASGAAHLEYRGNPQINQEVSGAASVQKSDQK